MEEIKEKKPMTEAQKRANLKYQRKFAHVSINMERDLRERAAKYCESNGTSLGRLVNDYLENLLAEEGF